MDRHAGKGQDIILETLKRSGKPMALTDIARQARGLHFPERIPPAVKGAVEKFFKDAPKLGK